MGTTQQAAPEDARNAPVTPPAGKKPAAVGALTAAEIAEIRARQFDQLVEQRITAARNTPTVVVSPDAVVSEERVDLATPKEHGNAVAYDSSDEDDEYRDTLKEAVEVMEDVIANLRQNLRDIKRGRWYETDLVLDAAMRMRDALLQLCTSALVMSDTYEPTTLEGKRFLAAYTFADDTFLPQAIDELEFPRADETDDADTRKGS